MDNFPIEPNSSPFDLPSSLEDAGLINSGSLESGGGVGGAIGDALASAIPGGKEIKELLSAVSIVPKIIQQAISAGEAEHPVRHVIGILKHGKSFLRLLELFGQDAWAVMADIGAGPLFTLMLEGGLGVSMSEFTAEELEAVQTIDTMIGFATAVPFIVAAVDAGGKALLANRWPEGIHDALKELPEEMGLTWPLGMTIERSFEAAQGTVLEEAINKQKRPNRVAWQQARVLLTQHVINKEQARDIFIHQGFPDEQIEWLLKLTEQTIPVGDIAQLWYREYIDDKQAMELITALGFSAEQANWLFELYISKAETTASARYHTIALSSFTNHLITADMYRHIMHAANEPKRLIEEDIKAVELEQSIGRVLHSVSEIKLRYLHHSIDEQEAKKELRELNYSDTYIGDLIQTWNLGPIKRSHGLSQAKILSYMVSGILSPQQAEPILLATGLDAQSVKFLIAHPTANAGVRQHARSPGLVTSAYIDGALQQDELEAAYKSAGVMDRDVQWYVDIAKHRRSHTKGTPEYTQHLTAADIRAALKAGLIDFSTCVHLLEQLGYRPDDAMLLTEITNKGPDLPPPPPMFPNLSAAEAYLIERGYKIIPAPDPHLLAAENMVIMAGESYQAPPPPPSG